MSHVTLITLGVRDLVKARDFYKGLGFRTDNNGDNPAMVSFQTGETTLSLYPIEGLAKDINEQNPPRVGSGFCGVTLAHNTASKEEVDRLFHKVLELGGRAEGEPGEVFWGGYHFYFRDLDGHYWEVAYPYPRD